MTSTRLVTALITGLVASAFATPCYAGWTLTDLGTLGGISSVAYGMNNVGQVVGYSLRADGKPYPFITVGGQMTAYGSANGGAVAVNDLGQGAGNTLSNDQTAMDSSLIVGNVTTDLGRLGGTYATSKAINSQAQVIGYAHLASGFDHAFVATAAGMTDLGTLSGGTNSYANAINASGEIVGNSYYSNYTVHGFIAHAGVSGLVDIGTLGGPNCFPNAINDAGQVVGVSSNGKSSHAFLYDGKNMTDLGTLGGTSSDAIGINKFGQIIGYSKTASGAQHGFLYSGRSMIDLGTLGGTLTTPLAINANAQVIGSSTLANGTKHAFFYSNGVMTDLETAVPGLSNININWLYLNDAGQIAGSGTINGNQHAFLLTPTP